MELFNQNSKSKFPKQFCSCKIFNFLFTILIFSNYDVHTFLIIFWLKIFTVAFLSNKNIKSNINCKKNGSQIHLLLAI